VGLRRLPDRGPELRLYHIAADVDRLERPATLELPVPLRDGKPPLAVDILHFHDAASPGNLLRAAWRPGQPSVTVEVQELSIIGMVIVWGAITWITGNEITIQSVANTPENFEAHAAAAINVALHKEVLLRVPAYDQHSHETMWCWAASFAGALQAARPLDRHLADPIKPQKLAAWGDYARTGLAAGPSATHWTREGSGILGHLSTLAGQPVEGRYFARYSALVVYLIQSLDAGYVVSLDVRAKTHTVNIVGYEARGLWLQDPVSKVVPELSPWRAIYDVIDQGQTSFSNNFVLTTVIKSDVSERADGVGLNLPSAEWGAPSSNVVNFNGLYFTTAERGAHVGFTWDGTAPGGMRLLVGRPGGPEAEPVPVLVVGAQTRIGVRNVEVSNVGTSPFQARLRVELMDPLRSRVTPLLDSSVSLPPRRISSHDLAEQPLLRLLPPEWAEVQDVVLRASVELGGAERDRIDLPIRLAPLRLDRASVRCRPADGKSRVELRGAGLRSYGARLVVVTPAGETLRFAQPGAGSDTATTIELDERPEALAGEMYLQIEPAGDVGPGRWPGLETNRVQASVERCTVGVCKPLRLCQFDSLYVFYGDEMCKACAESGSFCGACDGYKRAVDACSGGHYWIPNDSHVFGGAMRPETLREALRQPGEKLVYSGYFESRTVTGCFELEQGGSP
jgi:hypothetical protein